MHRTPERQLAHARALSARGVALPPDGRPDTRILDSWARCLDAGLDFAAPARLEVLEPAELERRRERAAFVRRMAEAELETLVRHISGSNFLLAFADSDGVPRPLFGQPIRHERVRRRHPGRQLLG